VQQGAEKGPQGVSPCRSFAFSAFRPAFTLPLQMTTGGEELGQGLGDPYFVVGYHLPDGGHRYADLARILALAFLAVLSRPALAHSRDFDVMLPVVSGSSNNSVELVLRVLHGGDGPRAVKAGSCRLSVTIEVRDATGANPTLVSKSASLGSGELFVFDLPLARFHDSGQVHAALEVTGSGVSRACLLEMTGTRRVTEPDTGNASAGSLGAPVQIPVNVPVNVCGNTVNVIGLLNPSFGNTCVNA
jgi:hypothetical protein